jgi:hypothetical protein
MANEIKAIQFGKLQIPLTSATDFIHEDNMIEIHNVLRTGQKVTLSLDCRSSEKAEIIVTQLFRFHIPQVSKPCTQADYNFSCDIDDISDTETQTSDNEEAPYIPHEMTCFIDWNEVQDKEGCERILKVFSDQFQTTE